MKLTFKQVLANKTWLEAELLSSLTHEVIESAKDKEEYEVFLLVNDVKLDPKLFIKIFNNLESYIDKEALNIANKKLTEALKKSQRIESIVQEAIDKIKTEFEISDLDLD